MKGFEKIIGYKSIKRELMRYADVLNNIEKYSALGVNVPSGILLCGDPGLGKTLMATCFIEETGLKAFVLRKEKSNGSFVNEIRKTYENARKEAPSIVFLDDMDKFSNTDSDYKDTEEYVTIQSCIDESKECGIFTLATSNSLFNLPCSLLRPGRFDEVIEVNPPCRKEVEEIIQYYLSQKKSVGDVDVKELSMLMDECPCAELENIINKAGIYAGYDNRDCICHQDIVDAFVRVMYESPECLNPQNNGENERVALHEAGHAVISEILEPGSVTLVSVCRNSYATQGITRTKRAEDYYLSKEHREKSVIAKLGGKAATEIILGEADVGCQSDLMTAHNIVEDLVDDFGTLGFETHTGRNSGGYVYEKKDRLIATELERYYREAKRIIAKNRVFVERVREELLIHHTLTYRDMEMIRTELELQKRISALSDNWESEDVSEDMPRTVFGANMKKLPF